MASPQETYDDTAAAASGRGCFRRFCLGRGKYEGHIYLLLHKVGGAPQKEPWFVAKLKKLKESSEMVAGPKWKNMIRKMGRIRNLRKQNKTAEHFQYSPESYALNFADSDHEDGGELLRSFSMRFAPGFFINDQQTRPVL